MLHLRIGAARTEIAQLCLAPLSHIHRTDDVEGGGTQAHVALIDKRGYAVPILGYPRDAYGVDAQRRLGEEVVLQGEGTGAAARLVGIEIADGRTIALDVDMADGGALHLELLFELLVHDGKHLLVETAGVHGAYLAIVGKGYGAAESELEVGLHRGLDKLHPLHLGGCAEDGVAELLGVGGGLRTIADDEAVEQLVLIKMAAAAAGLLALDEE